MRESNYMHRQRQEHRTLFWDKVRERSTAVNYEVYIDGERWEVTGNTDVTLEHLTPDREYLISVRAAEVGKSVWKNVTICGGGVIDANGVELYKGEMSEKAGARGRAVCLRNTDGVNLQDITIRQSPAWCVHFIYCNHVSVNGVKIYNKFRENGEPYGLHNREEFDHHGWEEITEETPTIKDVTFRNITLETIGGNAIYLCGLPENSLKNIVLESITAKGKYGMKLYHVDGMVLNNVSVYEEEVPVTSAQCPFI